MIAKYESPSKTAARWGVSKQRVIVFLRQNRVSGAVRETNDVGQVAWLVPVTAKKPARRKPGRRKTSENNF